MKRIKQKEGYPKCTYCTSKAVWKARGLLSHLAPKVCEEHKYMLVNYERDNRDDGYMTEADYQTWGRLR